MSRTSSAETSCMRIEGGILSPSIVRRLLSRDLPRSDAASYHLDGGYTLGEAVTRSWNRMRSAWKAFESEKEKRQSQPGAGVTRDKLLLPLFEELGFGRLPYEGSIEAGERNSQISHKWSHVPIHLVGADTDLDSRAEGVPGAARRSPHGLMLEYLNWSSASLWGFVSNGLELRLLRKNHNIARQPRLRFDLEALFEGESYSDFTLLWMICHESRLEGEPDASILEAWRTEGLEDGERALDDLRDGVEQAISIIGSGLISHPDNGGLAGGPGKGSSGRRHRQDGALSGASAACLSPHLPLCRRGQGPSARSVGSSGGEKAVYGPLLHAAPARSGPDHQGRRSRRPMARPRYRHGLALRGGMPRACPGRVWKLALGSSQGSVT